MNRLATLPLGKNDTLRDLTNHLIHVINVVEMKGVHQRQVYDLAGRALIRLKKAGKVKYIGGRGCGWRLP